MTDTDHHPHYPTSDYTLPEQAQEAPTLKLGELCQRLGFNVTSDFLNSLGFAPVATDKAAKLYRERDFPSICAAIARRVTSAARGEIAPAASMAAQAPVREVPGWQPIETAPKDGTSILAVMQGFVPSVVCWRAGYWMTADMEADYEDGEFDKHGEWNLTHWQPLPELPAAPVQKEGA